MIKKETNGSNYTTYLSIFLAGVLVVMVGLLIYRQLDEYQLQDDPKLNQLRDTFTTFFNKDKYWTGNLSMLNKRNVMKEINLYKGDKSYTINKDKVFMCLIDENGHYYSENMLIYVLAHEFAHVLATSVGHTEEFHRIFGDLLVELTDDGMYDPSQEIVGDYCQY